jgi:hypothetical protein
MPRQGGLEGASRYALVYAFIETLWPDAASRKIAAEHYGSRLEALPVHGPAFAKRVAASGIDPAAAGNPWTLLEDGLASDELSFTPGFTAFVGLEALERCKAAGKQGKALEQCLEQATHPDVHSKVRIPTPPP